MKRCKICGSEFEKSGTRIYCFECSPPYTSGGRPANWAALRSALRKEVLRRKGGRCSVCGYNKSERALEFHHLNPSQKENNITTLTMNVKVDEVFSEIEKCVLLCANCHAEAHDPALVAQW